MQPGGLEDLRTEQNSVRTKVAAYLNKLLGYGVSGFRVDAAKHIGQEDLDGIYTKLNRTRDGHKPYWALEVLGNGPGILAPQAFERSGKLPGQPTAPSRSRARSRATPPSRSAASPPWRCSG